MTRLGTKCIGGLAILAIVAAGCGDDDDGEGVGDGGDLERYCELVDELDAAGTEMFAPLEADENATEEDFEEAERQFVEDHEDDFDELREVVPDEIADDIEVLLDAQDERASGGDQEETSDEAATAEERVEAFETANCDS